MRRWIISHPAVLGLLLVVSVCAVWTGAASHPLEPSASETEFVLSMPNGLEIPVERAPLMTVEGVAIYQGSESMQPLKFDPAGEQQRLVVDRVVDDPPEPALSRSIGPVVYLGKNRSHPVFAWVQPARSAVGPADQWIATIFDKTLTCVGLPGGRGCSTAAGGEVDIASNIPSEGDFVSWIGVPQESAVVALELGGQSYWQRPVASSVWFAHTEHEAGDGTMTAYTSDGEVLTERNLATPTR